ncbi:MAG TPA: aminotransferase class V-fold PLP-dependent enzyme, partial [Chloroflexota bacterium]|nr:aminotransferase class V-fold PLP-dependent enzyme [Chloroflexota bacterium]
NLVGQGQRLLVVSNGHFGDRFAAIADAHGLPADRLAASWGTTVSAEQLADRLEEERYDAVAITHVDTSTGTAAPIAAMSHVARASGALVIVDTVCSLGGMPVDMDRNEIDVVLSGAQKALGVPPGLSVLLLSERALARRRSLGKISAYYADLLNWEASMEDPTIYFSTHAVNLFYALAAALQIIEAEGAAERFARHERLAQAFRAGCETLGFEIVTDPSCRAPTLSVLRYPAGVADEPFRAALGEYGVVAAGNLGALKGHGCRFGHMGNITEPDILRTLAAVEGALQESGALRADRGASLAAACRAVPELVSP